MIEFIAHNMAPIMFGCLVVCSCCSAIPVAFALAANGLAFAFIGIELGLFPANFLQAMPERVYGVMNNDTLLAIPFFTFMGLILERSGMAEDLLDTIGQLFGPIRGGLAYAVIFVGALLAATTGVVAASVISMGLISLPIMLRYGYDRRARHRRDRGLGHARPDHPAVAGADRPGRPARPLGRRHVRGGDHPGPGPDRALCRLRAADDHRLPEGGAGAAARGAHDPRGRRQLRHRSRSPSVLGLSIAVGIAANRLLGYEMRDRGLDRASCSPSCARSPTAISGCACSPTSPSR